MSTTTQESTHARVKELTCSDDVLRFAYDAMMALYDKGKADARTYDAWAAAGMPDPTPDFNFYPADVALLRLANKLASAYPAAASGDPEHLQSHHGA